MGRRRRRRRRTTTATTTMKVKPVGARSSATLLGWLARGPLPRPGRADSRGPLARRSAGSLRGLAKNAKLPGHKRARRGPAPFFADHKPLACATAAAAATTTDRDIRSASLKLLELKGPSWAERKSGPDEGRARAATVTWPPSPGRPHFRRGQIEGGRRAGRRRDACAPLARQIPARRRRDSGGQTNIIIIIIIVGRERARRRTQLVLDGAAGGALRP